MRVLGTAVLGGLLCCGPARSDDAKPALRFAWPKLAEAQVELTNERSVGDERLTIVMTMAFASSPTRPPIASSCNSPTHA